MWLFRFSGAEGCCVVPFIFMVRADTIPCEAWLACLLAAQESTPVLLLRHALYTQCSFATVREPSLVGC